MSAQPSPRPMGVSREATPPPRVNVGEAWGPLPHRLFSLAHERSQKGKTTVFAKCSGAVQFWLVAFVEAETTGSHREETQAYTFPELAEINGAASADAIETAVKDAVDRGLLGRVATKAWCKFHYRSMRDNWDKVPAYAAPPPRPPKPKPEPEPEPEPVAAKDRFVLMPGAATRPVALSAIPGFRAGSSRAEGIQSHCSFPVWLDFSEGTLRLWDGTEETESPRPRGDFRAESPRPRGESPGAGGDLNGPESPRPRGESSDKSPVFSRPLHDNSSIELDELSRLRAYLHSPRSRYQQYCGKLPDEEHLKNIFRALKGAPVETYAAVVEKRVEGAPYVKSGLYLRMAEDAAKTWKAQEKQRAAVDRRRQADSEEAEAIKAKQISDALEKLSDPAVSPDEKAFSLAVLRTHQEAAQLKIYGVEE